jgi:hypothetical protein
MIMYLLKKYTLLLLCLVSSVCFAQQASILTFNVKPVLPADVNSWTTIPAAVILVVKHNGTASPMVKPVFTIKQGGTRICGNTLATAAFVNIAPTHNFTTSEIIGNLNTCPKLAAGSYSLCVQLYPEDPRQQGEVKEVCREFRVEDAAPQFCNPPQNIGPRDAQIFTEKDFLIPKVFTWTPFITSTKTIITYKLTVWEVEEGQSAAQAMYDNFPLLQEDVKGQTRYTSKPSTWERRNATYVWRIEALDQEGKPICKPNTSEPTQFKITIAEKNTQDQPDSTTANECCKDSIKNVSNTVNVVPGSFLNVVQNFTISPNNITKINAEIAFVTESISDNSCKKCAANEAAVWNFMPMNKAIWNSGLPNNASPNNASGSYPAQNIIWFCNAQGNLKFDLKIALPGITSATCKRTGKVGIRFKFTDKDCKTCEQYIIYNYTIN